MMHRIYFDSNEGDPAGRYDLGIPGSLRDIAALKTELNSGGRVLLYMDDLEVEAVLDWDAALGQWWARPSWDTLRYLVDGAASSAAAE